MSIIFNNLYIVGYKMFLNKLIKLGVISLSLVTFSASAANVSTGSVALGDVTVWSSGHLVLNSDGAFSDSQNTCSSKNDAFVLSTHVAYKQYLAMALTAQASGQKISILYNTDDGCTANRAIVTRMSIVAE